MHGQTQQVFFTVIWIILMIVDQPVGTGFSYTKKNEYVKDVLQGGKHFVQFLEKFMQVFPYYWKAEIYMAGESFAGIYLPYYAQAILDRNLVETQKVFLMNYIIR